MKWDPRLESEPVIDINEMRNDGNSSMAARSYQRLLNDESTLNESGRDMKALKEAMRKGQHE